MKEVADIISDPASHFDGPVDLAENTDLTEKAKHAALSNWQQHAEALDVAADEGMGPAPEETPLRAELETAFEIVGEKSPAADRAKAEFSTQQQKEDPDMSRTDRDTAKLANDASQIGDDLTQLARSAIEAIQKVTDEFAAKAGASKNDAVDAVRSAGKSAASGLGVAATEARSLTESGLDTIGQSVVRNPLAALAIAAGTGLLLGLLSRQDTRR